MASLHVRDIDPKLIAKLKVRAAENGRSAAAEHRDILQRALADVRDLSFEELAAKVRASTATRRQTPAEVLVREGREEH
jgi:plasmid stability protein